MTAKAYLLKIRGGVEVDSKGQKAGKGPLIAEEISNTLGTSQDQYLFQPVDKFVLDDQGGSVIRWRWDGKSPCLRAQMGGHTPVVLENHPSDSRVRIDESGIVQTLTSSMGTGGGNVPMVMMPFSKSRRAKSSIDFETWKPVICIQGNVIDRSDNAGANGAGWRLNQCYTLNTIDRPAVVYALDQQGGKGGANYSEDTMPTLCSDSHGTPHAVVYPKKTGPLMANSHPGSYSGQDAYQDMFVVEKCPTITASAGLGGTWKSVVAYGISSYESNAMKSSNPHAGIYETNTARTIDVNGGNPACNQGGVVIVYSVDEKMGQTYIHEDKADTLAARDFKQPQIVVMSERAMSMVTGERVANTLTATDYKGVQILAIDRAAFNQGENAKYDFQIDGGGTAQTLIARGPGAVCYRKPVRK